MVSNMNIRTFRPQPNPFGLRQQVINRPLPGISRQLIKQAFILVLVGMLLLLSANLFLNRQVTKNMMHLEALKSTRAHLVNENISLRAARASLTSMQHIEKIAATKLHLFLPEKDQISKL